MLVSVITAVPARRLVHVGDAWASLKAQDGSWEWQVEIDGDTTGEAAQHVRDLIGDDARVRVRSHPRTLGTAITRNLALAHARGDVVMPLDDDDLLLPGAIAATEGAFCEHAGPGAVFFGAYEYDTTAGIVVERAAPLCGFGIQAPGTLERWWRDRGWSGLHWNAAAYDHRALLRAGGWPAVPTSEDLAAALFVTQSEVCVTMPDPSMVWRRFPGQMTQTDDHRLLAERAHRTISRQLDTRAGRPYGPVPVRQGGTPKTARPDLTLDGLMAHRIDP